MTVNSAVTVFVIDQKETSDTTRPITDQRRTSRHASEVICTGWRSRRDSSSPRNWQAAVSGWTKEGSGSRWGWSMSLLGALRPKEGDEPDDDEPATASNQRSVRLVCLTTPCVSERAEGRQQRPGDEQRTGNPILDARSTPQLAVLDLQIGVVDREFCDPSTIVDPLRRALRQALKAHLASRPSRRGVRGVRLRALRRCARALLCSRRRTRRRRWRPALRARDARE